jgi:phosphatidylserine/phosphatidylglycerophosphate/cardiolipin synthase-like enzyme
LASLLQRLAARTGSVQKNDLVTLASTPQSRSRLEQLELMLLSAGAPSGAATSLALQAVVHANVRGDALGGVEIAWTGPGTEAVPVRRVDQVMYELIDQARRRVLLASFVTYGAAKALHALEQATERGVEVVLILEKADETRGKLEFDGLAKVGEAVPGAKIFYWPIENREVGASGKTGILHVLHAKCLIVDEENALVSSANLTDQGLELNMELGVLFRGGSMPGRLSRHLLQLIREGELVALS